MVKFLIYDPPRLNTTRRRHLSVSEALRDATKAATTAPGSEPLLEPLSSPDALDSPSDDHHHEHGSHKAADWAELFCDLVFVSIIAELSHLVIGAFAGGGHHRRLYYEATDDHATDDNATDDHATDDHSSTEPFGWTPKMSASLACALYGVLAWEAWLLEMTYTSRFDKGADAIGRLLSFCFMASLVVFAGTVGTGFSDPYDMSWAFVAHGFATMFTILKYFRAIICNPEEAKPLRIITIPLLLDSCFFFVAANEVYNSVENAIVIVVGAKVFRNGLVTFNWLCGGFAGKDYYKMATNMDAHYVTERFGLLSIIVMGETILSVVAGVKAGANSQGIEVPNLIYSFTIVFR